MLMTYNNTSITLFNPYLIGQKGTVLWWTPRRSKSCASARVAEKNSYWHSPVFLFPFFICFVMFHSLFFYKSVSKEICLTYCANAMNVRIARGTSIDSLDLGSSVAMERVSGVDRALCAWECHKNGDSAPVERRKFCNIRGFHLVKVENRYKSLKRSVQHSKNLNLGGHENQEGWKIWRVSASQFVTIRILQFGSVQVC